MKKSVFLLFMLMVWTNSLFAQVNIGENTEFSGLLFGDYFWMANHHTETVEGSNGFWIRRIYLTLEHDISNSFSTRLRLEMNTEGDFVSSSKMTPVVKDAYLKWKNEEHQLLAGISGTPTWGLVEDVWGYRSVEQTPLDLYGFGSSRDFGVAAKGSLGDMGSLEYHVMLGNGNSNASEFNRGKKSMLALTYNISEEVVVQIYGDWNDLEGETDWLTIQGFAAYQTDDWAVGVLYAHQNRNNARLTPGGRRDWNLDIASVFTNFSISEKHRGFLRIDHAFDPVPGTQDNDYIPISNRAESTFMVGGIDLELDPKVHLMPNIELIFYNNPVAGDTPDTDFIPRLTLFFTL